MLLLKRPKNIRAMSEDHSWKAEQAKEKGTPGKARGFSHGLGLQKATSKMGTAAKGTG